MFALMLTSKSILKKISHGSAGVRAGRVINKRAQAMNVKTIKPNELLILSNKVITLKDENSKESNFNIDFLQKISILTTDQGPFFDDVALALFFEETALILPSEHCCYKNVYAGFSECLSLNYDAVIKAMSCAENAEFIVWTK